MSVYGTEKSQICPKCNFEPFFHFWGPVPNSFLILTVTYCLYMQITISTSNSVYFLLPLIRF